jgi:hypothetical protein
MSESLYGCRPRRLVSTFESSAERFDIRQRPCLLSPYSRTNKFTDFRERLCPHNLEDECPEWLVLHITGPEMLKVQDEAWPDDQDKLWVMRQTYRQGCRRLTQ